MSQPVKIYEPYNVEKWLERDLFLSNKTKRQWFISSTGSILSVFGFYDKFEFQLAKSDCKFELQYFSNTFYEKLKRLFKKENGVYIIKCKRKIK